MLKKSLLILFGISFSVVCHSQVIVSKYVKLPDDTVQSTRLINSLHNFLEAVAKPTKDNVFVLKADMVETSCLIDELRGMQNAGADKKNFYRYYLSNIAALDSTRYIVQLCYQAVNEGIPVLRASFKLIATRQVDGYLFSSPLKLNTEGWKVKKTGNFSVYTNTPAYTDKLTLYVKKAIEYDKRIHAPNYPSQVYCCENFVQALALLGVEYKMDYNGISHDNLSTWEGGHSLYIIGASQNDQTAFDHHDLWHSRLHHVVSTDVINRPVDEACAYLYGGSWGIYTWPDILKLFKANTGADHDWLKAFNNHGRFGGARSPLYVDYVIDALIIQKLEKEKGFEAVIELLSCGKKQADNENFFKALDRVSGINKGNFNTSVEALVTASN